MPVNKKQLQRLKRLVGQLKENRYPNCKSFAEELREADLTENLDIICCRKTILRDIKLLKDEFNAPIKFDVKENGYHLTHKGWDFDLPQLLSDSEMLAAVLGARLAEEIFPEPLRSEIREAVDSQLTDNNPDFLDSAQINSLIVVPRLMIAINADIFMQVFKAWQEHKGLSITYQDTEGTITERLIEPHIFAFYDQAWYVKGWCRLRNEVRSFAIHRIIKAEPTKLSFEPDRELINRTRKGNFLEYKKIMNIEIVCANELKSFIEAKPFHEAQNIQPYDAENILLTIPAAPEHEIVKWVMYQSGKAKLINPPALMQKIHQNSIILAKMHTSLS